MTDISRQLDPASPEGNRDVVLIFLSSGHSLRMKGVLLFPTEDLAEIARLRADAATKLGAVSSGLGFIGSPAWAIGASAVVGFLERAASNSAQKAGFEILAHADQLSKDLNSKGIIFSARKISGISTPDPRSWSATRAVKIPYNLSPLGHRERKKFLSERGFSEENVIDNCVTVDAEKTYAHNGDDFVLIDVDPSPISIRWSSVVGFSVGY